VYAKDFAPFWVDSRPPLPTGKEQGAEGPFVYPYPPCVFGREGGKPPNLPVRLGLRRAAAQLEQDVSWRVGLPEAEFQTQARLRSPAADLAVIEWDLAAPQPLTVVSVVSADGPRVRRWSQNGNRMLVWLDGAAAAVRLELTGWTAVKP